MSDISPHLFREYDIRGVVPSELHAEAALKIAHAFARMVAEQQNTNTPRICLGWDGRLSSPMLQEAISEGLKAAGAEVLKVGLGPTPLTYFAVFEWHADGCIMITGSHNPPDYNGLKMMTGTAPFFGADITTLKNSLSLREWAGVHVMEPDGADEDEEDALPPTPTFADEVSGDMPDIRETYLNTLLAVSPLNHKPLTVVWDTGNGAAGEVVQSLVSRLAGTHHVLFGDIDGTFPNHHPDPSEAHNLLDLQREVATRGADIGIAFDGDGDRIGLIDAKGRIVAGDQILALCAQHMLKKHQGALVIVDVKTSQAVIDAIAAAGGVPLIWKTGHSNIKSKMKETGALLAGEMSGHMFFADRYFGFDDAIYAAMRVLEMLADSTETLDEMLDRLPKRYNTPEIRIDCADEKKFAMMEQLVATLSSENATFLSVDGVRVSTSDGWWLLRASNTQPVLVARAESSTEEGLKRLQKEIYRRLEMV